MKTAKLVGMWIALLALPGIANAHVKIGGKYKGTSTREGSPCWITVSRVYFEGPRNPLNERVVVVGSAFDGEFTLTHPPIKNADGQIVGADKNVLQSIIETQAYKIGLILHLDHSNPMTDGPSDYFFFKLDEDGYPMAELECTGLDHQL